jgi:hypothetical protein
MIDTHRYISPCPLNALTAIASVFMYSNCHLWDNVMFAFLQILDLTLKYGLSGQKSNVLCFRSVVISQGDIHDSP